MLLQFDGGKRVVDMVYSKAGTQVMGYRYSWNRVGLRTVEERLHRGKFDQFSYDLQMRLKEAKVGIDRMNPSSFDKQLSYVLDLVDNIQKITETRDSITKEITTVINNRNQYTRFGNLNLSYDSNGNLKTNDSKTFAYDYKNQLVRYTDSEKTVEFRYDPFGRRIQKGVKLSGSQTSQLTNFYYEGYRVIEERDSSDNLKKQYIYGAGIDEILRMDIFENGTAKPYYFHHNLIGSITGITDNTGNIVELVEYDPYGKPYFLKPTGNPENPYEISETSTIGNNYLFQGREYDPETGLYYIRARYYHPELGRFLSPDPTGYIDSMNLYQAFSLNPINFIDPFGEFKIKVASADLDLLTSPDYQFSREYRSSLYFRFEFEFTSPGQEIGKFLGKEALDLILDLYLKKLIGLKELHKIFEMKGWIDRILRIKDLFKRENILQAITDPMLERLYKDKYRERSLTTEEAIEFLKIAREVLRVEFPEAEEIYEWEKLLERSVSEWESSKSFRAWLGKNILSIQMGMKKAALISQYREYKLRQEGKDTYYEPATEELYEFLKRYWQEKVRYEWSRQRK